MASRASSDVVVRFIGDTGSLDRGLNNLTGRFQAVTTSLQGIATAGAVVGAVSFFKGAIAEAREAERVGRKTEAVIKSTGGVARVTAGHISELSGSMSELAGVDDEVIQQGANVLATFTKVRNEVGNGNNIFDQAAQASLNMAAALDKTGDSGAAMQENIVRVGKALNDPIKGLTTLAKVGVTFTDQQKEQVKAFVEAGDILSAQKIILRELQTEFGGMAEASADATSKSIVSWGNFAEDMGKKVLPAVNAVSDWALHTGIPALGSMADTATDVVEPAFQGLVTTGGALIDMWQSLPGPIQTGVIALAAWQLVGDRVTDVFGRMGGGMRGFGSDVTTAMGAFDVGRVQGTLMAIEERIPVIGQMGQAFRDSAGAGLALSSAMPGLSGGMLQFSSVVKGTAAAAVTGLKVAGSGLVSFLGGPWGLAIAGAAAAMGFLASRSAEAKAKQEQMYGVGKRVAEIMRDQTDATRESIRAKVAAEAADSGMLQRAEKMGISASLLTDALMGNKDAWAAVEDKVRAYDARLEELDGQNSSTLEGVGEFFGVLDDESDIADGFMESLGSIARGHADVADKARLQAEAMGKTTEATTKYAVVGSTAKQSTDLMKAAVESAGIELEEGADATDHMREAIEALTRTETAQMDTMEGYEASLDGLDASIAEHGHTLDIATEAGRANRDALEEVAAKSRDLMLADIEAGVPANEALARHNARITALKDEATAAFGANSEANTLIDTYGRVPKNIVTAIEAKGAEDVLAAMDKLSAGQYLLANALPMTPANVRAVLQERKSRYADGGRVGGSGGPRQDNVHALLSVGEVVESNAAGDYYGRDFLVALNERRIPREALPQFAGGGMVWPIPVDLSKTKIPTPNAYLAADPNAVRGPGGPGMGWQNMWAVVKARFGTATLNSAFRRGDPGYHGRGRAIDIGGPMAAINRWLAGAYPNSTELIYTPGINLWHGRPHTYKAATRADHYDHVHWAMANGGLVGKPGGFKDGGWLGPGKLGFNETSSPEPVLSTSQWEDVGGLVEGLRALVAVLEKNTGQPSKVINVGGIHVANRPADVMQQIRFAEMAAGI